MVGAQDTNSHRDSERRKDADTPELLARFGDRDEAAYEVLWRRYRAPLMGFIAKHMDRTLRARMSDEDVLQDVHLAALRRIDSFEYRRPLSFFFWLCQIARRRIATHYRTMSRRPVTVSRVSVALRPDLSSADIIATLECNAPSPYQQASLQRNLAAVAVALQNLAPRREQAILLRYIDGLSTKEAAARLEVSDGAFRVLLSRALIDLRAQLDGEAAR